MNSIYLIAGVPACGKTRFGDYLRDEEGYFHLDMESLDDPSYRGLWEAGLAVQNLALFVERLAQEDRPVVLTWGFQPPGNLAIVRALQGLGVSVWWFYGDEAAARDAFIERGDGDVSAFDEQMRRIKGSWNEIQQIIGPRSIRTLEASGLRKPLDAILSEIGAQK